MKIVDIPVIARAAAGLGVLGVNVDSRAPWRFVVTLRVAPSLSAREISRMREDVQAAFDDRLPLGTLVEVLGVSG